MKLITLLFLFLIALVIPLRAQQIKLPIACKRILDKYFHGWKLTDISADIKKYHQENKFSFEPNLIKGDWNADGKTDYAVLIQKNKETQTIAFLRDDNSYKHFTLDGGDNIGLLKKGEKGYNYEKQKDFIYQNDAISVGFWEKGGNAYMWRKNKFISIVTSD
jgi:hypothetical protein